MQTPKSSPGLRRSPRAGREGLAAAVASFRLTENSAHPLSEAEATKNLHWFLPRRRHFYSGKSVENLTQQPSYLPFF